MLNPEGLIISSKDWPSLTVALTGGLASGKSTIASMLRSEGCTVFDADEWAREVVHAGAPAMQRLVELYGKKIVKLDGSLNRARLLTILLSSPHEKYRIEKIVHPELFRLMDNALFAVGSKHKWPVVVEIPLLYETGMEQYFDMVIVVTASLNVRIRRLMKRNGVTKDTALKWIDAQMPQDEKAAKADIVISNDDGYDQLAEKVRLLAAQLRRLHEKVSAQ